MVDEFEKRIDYAKKYTALPEKPDYKRIEDFTMGSKLDGNQHGEMMRNKFSKNEIILFDDHAEIVLYDKHNQEGSCNY